LRRSIPLAMWEIAFSFVLSWRRSAISSCMSEHLELAIFGLLVASALFSRRESYIRLRQGLLMGLFLVMLNVLERIVCSTLMLAKSWRLVR
jgi:hypothetical protein